MSDRIERFIKMAFEDWKKDQPDSHEHPSEEEIACFLEGRLNEKDTGRLKEHLISCDACAELMKADLSVFPAEEIEVPQDLLDRARGMVSQSSGITILDIVLKVKELGFEIINTTGDVLFGQELIPAAVLRSRNIQEFKEEVAILKDFGDNRIEVRIQSWPPAGFNLVVLARDKKTHKALKETRITLFKDDVELESKVSDMGKVVFEHIEPGKYSIEVSGTKEKIAMISLDVRP
jgi:hypothetical protein